MEYFLLIFIFGIPLLLTIVNVFSLLAVFHDKQEIKSQKTWDLFTILAGAILSLLLFFSLDFKEWQHPVIIGEIFSAKLHTPLSGEFHATFISLYVLAILSFLVLRFIENLPPLISVFCVSGVLVGFVLSVFWIVQMWKNIDQLLLFMLIVFPINFIMCSIRLIKAIIARQTHSLLQQNAEYRNRFIAFIYKTLSKSTGWIWVAFVLMFPLLCVVFAILLLFGQSPDSVVKMFTHTSDWTFSQMTSPPPEIYQGHYLCTVAAKGDERLVKPQRIGVRHGYKIIVNRQLCVANAFEDFIKEKFPKTHKIIRNFYDNYGYPLSKKITTKTRANVTYLMMKPLEWLFVLFLYTFDLKPEQRIARQYADSDIC